MSRLASGDRSRVGKQLMLWPLPILLALFYLLPFFGVVGWSVMLPAPGLGNYQQVLTDGELHRVLWRTLRICLIVALVALTLAYLLAYVYVFSAPRWQRLVELGVFLPFWLSVLVRTFGWLIALRSNGPLNQWLQALGLISAPLQLTRNEVGVAIGMVNFMVPFAFFPLLTTMRRVDPRVLLAARGLGASRLRSFFWIFLPQTVSGLLGAFIMVFVFCVGFFVIPVLLGGGQTVMVAEYIFLQMFQTSNWGLGAALSVVLLAGVALLCGVLVKVTRVDRALGPGEGL